MSLVGPCAGATSTTTATQRRQTAMTGWAQINSLRGNAHLAARIQHDIYYIKNWSLWLDVQIIF